MEERGGEKEHGTVVREHTLEHRFAERRLRAACRRRRVDSRALF